MTTAAKVPLASRGFALVDESDLPLVSRWSWHLHSQGYARRTGRIGGRQVREYMHRLILGAKRGEQVDHINGDRLDNQRANLRLADACQNGANRHGASVRNKTTGALGVYRDKLGRISAYIRFRGVRRYLGSFSTIEAARAARTKAEAETFGDFAPRLTGSGA